MSSDDNHDNGGRGKPRYQAGYGKPPKQHQFKKGVSGNPKGRKPRVKNVSTLLQIELDKFVVVRDGETQRKITKREALIISLVNDAITSKSRARTEMLKLLDVSPPPEPFIANDDDEAALDEFLKRTHRRRRGNDDDNGEGGLPHGEST